MTLTNDRLSLKSSDGTEGGGTEGALATIKEIEFVDEFDYNGKSNAKGPQAALRVLFDIDGFEKPWEQHYTIGPSKNFEVTDKGNGIRSLGKQTGLNKGCNAYKFLTAAEQADGYAGYHDEGTVEAYDGLSVRLTNLDYETVSGDKKKMIVIGSFEAASNGNGKSSKGSSSKDSDAIGEKTDEAIKSLLEDTPRIKRKELANAVYDANKKDKDVKAMMQLCFKDQWVGAEDRSFAWDRKKDVITAKDWSLGKRPQLSQL